MVFVIDPESGFDLVESVVETGELLLHAARIAKTAKVRRFFIIASLDE